MWKPHESSRSIQSGDVWLHNDSLSRFVWLQNDSFSRFGIRLPGYLSPQLCAGGVDLSLPPIAYLPTPPPPRTPAHPIALLSSVRMPSPPPAADLLGLRACDCPLCSGGGPGGTSWVPRRTWFTHRRLRSGRPPRPRSAAAPAGQAAAADGAGGGGADDTRDENRQDANSPAAPPELNAEQPNGVCIADPPIVSSSAENGSALATQGRS